MVLPLSYARRLRIGSHLAHFGCLSVLGGLPAVPLRTLSRLFCAQWHRKRYHLARFGCLSVPGGHLAAPPRTLSRLFRAQWHRKQYHWVRFPILFAPGGYKSSSTSHSLAGSYARRL